MAEEGKHGDKVKECRETTAALFVLKELPHHSALMGTYEHLAIRRSIKQHGHQYSRAAWIPPRFQLVYLRKSWKSFQSTEQCVFIQIQSNNK